MKIIDKVLYRLPIIGERMKEKAELEAILHPVISKETKQHATEMIAWHKKRLEVIPIDSMDCYYHKDAIKYWETYLK